MQRTGCTPQHRLLLRELYKMHGCWMCLMLPHQTLPSVQRSQSKKCLLPRSLTSTLTRCRNSARAASDAHPSDAPTHSSTTRCLATIHPTLGQRLMPPWPASSKCFFSEKHSCDFSKLSTGAIENMHFIFSKALIPKLSPYLQPLLKRANHEVYHLVLMF